MLASPELLIEYSVLIALAGTLAGTLVSLVYHTKLWRALAKCDAVPRDWLLRPFAYHRRLESDRQASLLPWFYTGVSVFSVVAIACALAVVGLVRLVA